MGGPLLRREPVQPRHPGAAPAGQHLQALRLPDGLRGHLRRPGAAAHHARHGGRGRARRLLLRGQGVHPAELRGQVPGLRHAAHGPRQEPQRGDREGGRDGGLRPGRRPVVEEAGHGRPAIKPYPAVALGSFEATPLEMATAYNVLANGGLKVEPVTVLRGHRREGADPRAAPATSRRCGWSTRSRPSWSRTCCAACINEGTAAAAPGHGLHRWTRRARPARPTTCATPGSRATRPTCSASSGWASTTTRRSTSRARGPRCPIWVDFMKGALAGVKDHPFDGAGRERHLRGHRQADGPAGRTRTAPRSFRGLHRRHRAPRALPTSTDVRPTTC